MKYKMLGIAAVALFAVTAFADGARPRSGLWESITQSSMLSAAQEMMAALPPAERKQVEDMIAAEMAQLGSSINEAGMIVTKACVTPEMAKLGLVLIQPPQGNCALTASSSVDNTVKVSFACTEPAEVSGEIEATYQSDSAYSAVGITVANGQIVDTQTVSARWLGVDCGDVEPRPFIK
ncbi:MAG: DUF3617 domain-containing protein [Betaproteobacteria bacterium]|nr:DUF3617 domain-containing protein [Betaproteobacteria bacterium]